MLSPSNQVRVIDVSDLDKSVKTLDHQRPHVQQHDALWKRLNAIEADLTAGYLHTTKATYQALGIQKVG